MNFRRLEKQIKADEGYNSEPYLDSVGVPTIGWGSTHLFGHRVTPETPPITPEQATIQLRADMYGAMVTAQELFDRFEEMDAARQEVLVNMAYNLGGPRLAKFKRMRTAAYMLDYEGMGREMRDSRWFRQVGERGVRLARQMESG